MVARARRGSRLLPHRVRGRAPALALPRRPARPRPPGRVVRPRAVRVTAPQLPYAELAVTTNFSFLHGAAHPQEFVAQAASYGLEAIGIADRNTVAGVVRAHAAARALEPQGTAIRILPGVRLVTEEG
ncbi:MAG: PHP domain-containing protein, partial [Thermoleophilia bacterium]|nr:PHP domain-containing protein [Thermoleophilia bacterium]